MELQLQFPQLVVGKLVPLGRARTPALLDMAAQSLLAVAEEEAFTLQEAPTLLTLFQVVKAFSKVAQELCLLQLMLLRTVWGGLVVVALQTMLAFAMPIRVLEVATLVEVVTLCLPLFMWAMELVLIMAVRFNILLIFPP